MVAVGAPAQTWNAPAATSTVPYGAWEDPANWSTGVVPDTAAATAAFTLRSSPTGQQSPLISSAITVGAITFLPGDLLNSFDYPPVHVGSTRNGGATGQLTIAGTGTTPTQNSALVLSDGSLSFTSSAVSRANIGLTPDGSGGGIRRLIFADQSSLRADVSAAGQGGNTIEFRDQASWNSGTITLRRNATVIFRDHATVADGAISTPDSFSLFAYISVQGGASVSGLDLVAQPYAGTVLDLSSAAGPVALRSLTGWVDVALGANTLILDHLPQAANYTLRGAISGTGGLVLASNSTASVLVTQANNNYTGWTTISGAGILVHLVDGGRLNNVSVYSPATLRIQGSGTVGGYLWLRNGTLRLANLTQAGLVVQGSARLGGKLVVDIAPGIGQVGTQRYPFLTATSIDERFNSVTGLLATAMLQSRVDYGIMDAAIIVEQQSFATVGGSTPAARAFGAYLDTHTAAAPATTVRPLLATLNQLATGAAVTTALTGLAPDRYAVLPALDFGTAANRQSALTARLRAVADGPEGASVFFEGGTRRARYDDLANSPAARAHADTGLAGVLWRRPQASFGLFAATDRRRAELDATGSRDRAKETTGGAFGEWRGGATFVQASLSASRTRHDLTRQVTGAIGETAQARPDSRRTDAALEIGHAFTPGKFALTPSLGVLGSQWHMDDFTEAGAPVAALALSGWSQRSVRSRIGLEVAPRTPGRLAARLVISWLHEFADVDGFTTRLVSDPGAGYRTNGRDLDGDLFTGSLMLTAQLGGNGSAWLRLGGTRGESSRTTSDFSLGLGWRF